MKEIEVKARLVDKDTVMEKLASLGCEFEDAIEQNDTVYVKNIGSMEEYRTNDLILRIRIKNKDKIIFTLKKKMANDLDSLEHETEIALKEQMEQALLLMGYKEVVRINKTRVITHYNDCEICIDEVENLGSFIEMEKLTEDGDSNEIQTELFKFLMSVGVKEEDRVRSGYDILMLQNKYK